MPTATPTPTPTPTPLPTPTPTPIQGSALTACGTLNVAGATYVLQNDVSSLASCFNITANNVELNLNGHTVTYDAFVGPGFPNEGFEIGTDAEPSSWDLSLATHARRRTTSARPFVGQWQLAWEDPVPGEEIISPWTTLQAGVPASAYFLRGDRIWAYASGTAPQLRMRVESQGGPFLVDTTFSGTQQEFAFTPAVAGQYRLRLSVVAFTARNSLGDPIMLDEMAIHPTGTYGVQIAPGRTGGIIKNGVVIQGAGRSSRAHAVVIRSGTVVDALSISNVGMEAACISGGYAHDADVGNVQCVSDSPYVFSRQQLSAALNLSNSARVKIHDNAIVSGEGWGCIYVSSQPGAEVYGNDCLVSSAVTNHHGIIAYAATNAKIHNNFVSATYGQGILVSAGFDGLQLYDNVISLDGIRPNAEYGLLSFDAIRLNDYGTGGSDNIEVYGNIISISGGLDPFHLPAFAGMGDGKALNGLMVAPSGTGNVIRDNDISVSIDDPETIGSCWETGGANGGLTYLRNVCRSNNKNMVIGGYAGASNGVQLTGNTFERLDPAVGVYHTLFTRRTSAQITATHLLDSILVGGAALDSAYLYTYGSSPYEFFVDWSLTINTTPNAAIEIRDSANALVYTGTSGPSGTPSPIPLTQYRRFGAPYGGNPQGFDYKTPHVVTVAGRPPVSVTMDAAKEITVP